MTIHNAEIARLFEQYALLLAIDDANPFRVRAYRNAARIVNGLPRALADMVESGADLSKLPAIGKDIAHKIAEMVETGRFKELEVLEKRLPASLLDLADIPGLGPKRIKLLFDSLNIRSPAMLAAAAQAGKLHTLPGFGPKIERQILGALAQHISKEKRRTLAEAEQIAEPLLKYLRRIPGVAEAVVAGSYRRRRETVGDLDIIVTGRGGANIIKRFTAYPDVGAVVSKGTTRSTVRLRSGMQVDLRVVPSRSFGSALLYFTGSKAHNIAIRAMAVKRKLKINEYGVYKGAHSVAGRTEKDVYAQIGLPYIEPELREDRGEIAAAKSGKLPKLIALSDIRGDLHMHTKATDGHNTIEEMAVAAKKRGYSYIAISDHTKHVAVAHGLDAKSFARHLKAIDRVAAKLAGIRVLKSAEVDILADGSLDLPNSILRDLDFAIAAVHYKFDLPARQQTERIIRAMDNPYIHIVAHPTGRLLGERPPYALDRERLMKAAKARGCCLEINGQPLRLDLSDEDCRRAKDLGVKLVIATDAHSAETLSVMRFGVDQARRGWLEAGDVLNTKDWPQLRHALERR